MSDTKFIHRKYGTYLDEPDEQLEMLVILHNGNYYRLQTDNYGNLILSCDYQLIVRPKAANSVAIEME